MDRFNSIRLSTRPGLTIQALCWNESGAAGAADCVFLHGFGQSARVWDDVITCLGDVVRPVAIDLPGHGASDWDPEASYDLDTLTRDVELGLNQAVGESVTLVGHSLGGAIAMRLAGRIRHRIRSLILVDSGPDLSRPAVESIRRQEHHGARLFDSAEDYFRVLEARHPLAERSALRRLAASGVVENAEGSWERRLDPRFGRFIRPPSTNESRVWRNSDLWESVTGLECPTLIVRGAVSSVLSRDSAQRLVQSMKNCEFIEIRRAGHGVPLENALALGAVIRSFLERLPRPAGEPRNDTLVTGSSR